MNNSLSKAEMERIHSLGIDYNFDKPVLKDTTIVHDGGFTVIRFLSDNPGWWSFHCHLSFHLEAGMR